MKATKTTNRLYKSPYPIALAAILAFASVGCDHQSERAAAPVRTAAVPVMEPVLTAWHQSNEESAVSLFLEADWNARPLFASNSVLNLRADQIGSLPPAESDKKWSEVMKQTSMLNRLAAAVDRAGRDAAARQNLELAKKYFDALRQCGHALDKQNWLIQVQAIGRIMKMRADFQTAKITNGLPPAARHTPVESSAAKPNLRIR